MAWPLGTKLPLRVELDGRLLPEGEEAEENARGAKTLRKRGGRLPGRGRPEHPLVTPVTPCSGVFALNRGEPGSWADRGPW